MIILLIVLLSIVNLSLCIAIGGIEVASFVAKRADNIRKNSENVAVAKASTKGKKAFTGAMAAKLGVDASVYVGVKLPLQIAKESALFAIRSALAIISLVVSVLEFLLLLMGGVAIAIDFLIFVTIVTASSGYLVLFGATGEGGELTINNDVVAVLGSPTSGTYIPSVDNVSNGNLSFTTYGDLTDDEILQIAALCQQEQGSVAGAAAEASLMCNLYESSRGDRFDSLYDYVRDSGWFYNSEFYMDQRLVSADILSVVDNVVRKGYRVLPRYIDEHDNFGDIESASNNGVQINVRDRGQYKKNVTRIDNRSGSTYTFYCFPEEHSDPFGYTSEELRELYGDDCYSLEEAITGGGTVVAWVEDLRFEILGSGTVWLRM